MPLFCSVDVMLLPPPSSDDCCEVVVVVVDVVEVVVSLEVVVEAVSEEAVVELVVGLLASPRTVFPRMALRISLTLRGREAGRLTGEEE